MNPATFFMQELNSRNPKKGDSKPERGELCSDIGSADKKDTRYKRGQKSLKYRKPAVRDLLTAGVERVKGIEPSYSAWEADVLPLNYTRMDRTTMILAHSAEKIKRGEGKKTDRIVKNCKRGHRGSALSSRILKRNRGRRIL